MREIKFFIHQVVVQTFLPSRSLAPQGSAFPAHLFAPPSLKALTAFHFITLVCQEIVRGIGRSRDCREITFGLEYQLLFLSCEISKTILLGVNPS